MNDPKNNITKSYNFEFNKTLNAMMLKILDSKGMFPLYFHDKEGGLYKIIKTRSGKLQMSK